MQRIIDNDMDEDYIRFAFYVKNRLPALQDKHLKNPKTAP